MALMYASAEGSRMSEGGAAAEGSVVDFDLQLEQDLAQRVLAGGDAADGELAKMGRDPRHPLDCHEVRVDRAVADRGVPDQDPVGCDGSPRRLS
jgi:hypothetical protein